MPASAFDPVPQTAGPRGLSPASLRGVYLWAGDATIALQRAKFPDTAVDEEAHRFAHTKDAAHELARVGFNLVFLSMNWGFPPEREMTHRAQFRDAAEKYHEEGFRVIGYVQASNCLAEGSHADRDWYARTPDGRKVPYYRRRLMTCWNHPDWIDEVRTRALDVLDAGGDGVFFDNLWMGATPWVMGGEVGGFAGCACSRCVMAFRSATGMAPPRRLRTGDPAARAWLAWRTDLVTSRLAAWAAAIRQRRPGAWVLANNPDVILRDTAGLFGLDPARLAAHEDAILVENIAMPRIEDGGRRLIASALPLKALRALVPGRAILNVTYERGIGLDGAPSAEAITRLAGEAAALGVVPVIKGSEYLDGEGRFSVLTAPAFADTRGALAPLFAWLRANQPLFTGLEPDPDSLVLYDPEAIAAEFPSRTAATLGVACALLSEGVSFALITPDRLATAGQTVPLLVPPGVPSPASPPMPVSAVPAAFLAPLRIRQTVSRSAPARALADPFLRWFARQYFGSAHVRRLVDRTGVTAGFLRSPYFRVPARPDRIRDLARPFRPSPRPAGPALVERWLRDDGARLIHLVNYGSAPITVRFAEMGDVWRLHTPDADTRGLPEGGGFRLHRFAVLESPAGG